MQLLGLYDDRPFIRLAIFEFKGKKAEIKSLKSFIPNASSNVKQLYIGGCKGVVSMGMSTLVRTLDFKISSSRLIEQGLPFQVESITHLPIENLIYTSQLHLKKEGGAEATLFLGQKTALQALLDRWRGLSLEPDFVTSLPQALATFAHFRCPQLSSAFLIHLGSQEWNCVWVEAGKIKKAFVIPEGIEMLLSAFWEDRKKVLFQKEVEGVARQIDLLQLKPHLNPHLSTKLEELRHKLEATLYSFEQGGGKKPILFTGRTDSFGHLTEYLVQKFPDASPYEPSLPLSQEEKECAIAMGLALEGASKDRKKNQFLKNEFIPRKAWKRAGQWGFGLIATSLLLSISLSLTGYFQTHYQKKEWTHSLQRLMDRLAPGSFRGTIEDALSLIEEHDKEAYFIPQAPSLSEFLSWLSNHPLLEGLSATGDPLLINDVKYTLVSFPHIEAAKDPYAVQVDIEFQVKNPLSAKKFHETLLKEPLIDSKKEMIWESQSDHYRASFFLKNRTPYVF
ncbi:MAG: hypothetical protein KGJ02_01405 [Verrucomicrobiota bacterium]|nr:hypothetical protein [Verrucomicrobiota bacterium]